jgi:Tfp pilus assembly major pilin PilA
MAGKRIKGIRLSEFVVLLGVMGILASIAIPTYVDIQRRSRIEHLLASARSCREELPGWLSNSVSKDPVVSNLDAATEDERQTLDARGILEDYARIWNERHQQCDPANEGPLLVVERVGTPTGICRRDGRIHLIPVLDPTLEGVGAKVVVTAERSTGRQGYKGILAVYNVMPGGQEGIVR